MPRILQDQIQSDQKFSKDFWVALGSILFIAALVRFWNINARSLWFDEAFEFWVSNNRLEHIWQATLSAKQPPFFNFLLHFWMKIGSSEVWLRTLSVLFSLGGISGIFFSTHYVFGTRAAVIAGLIMSFLPGDVRYAQEVAEYAPLICFSSWMVYFHLRNLECADGKFWIVSLLFWLLGIYTHYGAAIIILSLSLINFIYNLNHKQNKNILKQVVFSLLFLLLAAPLITIVPSQIQSQNLTPAIITDLKNEVILFFQSVSTTFAFPILGHPWTNIPIIWSKLLVLLGILLIITVCFTGSKKQKVVSGFFLCSYLIYFVLVRLGFYGYGSFGFRYMVVLLPLFSTAFAGAVDVVLKNKLKASLIGYMVVIFLLGLSLYSLPNRWISEKTRGLTTWPETEDMQPLVDYLATKSDLNLPIYVNHTALPAFAYYVGLESQYSSIGTLPKNWINSCWSGEKLDFCTYNNYYFGVWNRSFTGQNKADSILQTFENPPTQFWLVLSHHFNGDQDSIEALQKYASYSVIEQRIWQGAKLLLLSLNPEDY